MNTPRSPFAPKDEHLSLLGCSLVALCLAVAVFLKIAVIGGAIWLFDAIFGTGILDWLRSLGGAS